MKTTHFILSLAEREKERITKIKKYKHLFRLRFYFFSFRSCVDHSVSCACSVFNCSIFLAIAIEMNAKDENKK